MTLLLVGLLLWTAAHYLNRVAPDVRAGLGRPGKALMAVVVLVGLALMIVGYRTADFIAVWSPPGFMVHVNNALMLLAFWVFGSSGAKGVKAWPAYKIRHPQLTGFAIWTVAHLLVNGDLAAILLFGGLMVWAVGQVILINRTDPIWTAPPRAGTKTYVRLGVITLVLYGLVTGVHVWFGLSPFPS